MEENGTYSASSTFAKNIETTKKLFLNEIRLKAEKCSQQWQFSAFSLNQ
jgi:hypothetical protein